MSIKERIISCLKPENIDYCLLGLTAILLPYDKIYGNIAIVLTAAWALFRIISRKKYAFFLGLEFWSMLLPVLVLALGIFYSQDKAEAGAFTGRMMSLAVFPIIAGGLTLARKEVNNILWGFIIAYTLRAFWVMLKFLYLSGNEGFKMNWYFQEFSRYGAFHPTYMGLYSIMVLLLLFYLYTPQRTKLIVVTGGFHFIFLFLLASRMALIALLGMLLVMSIYYLRSHPGYRKYFLWTWGGLIVFIIILFSQNRDLRFKFSQLRNTSWNYNKYDASSIATRIAKWKSALEIARQNPLLGTGTGDLQADLLKEFYKLDCLQCKVKKYNNPHNQFLDMLARNGLLGIGSLLFFLLYATSKSIKTKNPYFQAFLLVIILMFISECLLNREKGVELIAFFQALFLYGYLDGKSIV
jgi:O-antigen ligase